MRKTLLVGLLIGVLSLSYARPCIAEASLNSPLLLGTILFSSNRTGSWNIYRKNLTTGFTENLTNSSADNLNPHLSPDKRYMVFYSNREGNNQLYRMELFSKNVVRITNNQANEYDPQYSPNGKFIAFKSDLDDGRGDIWIMNSDGTNRHNLTPTLHSTEEWIPTFSRDSSKIYFVSGLQAYSEIRMISTFRGDAGGVYGLTFNSVDDWYPTVNPVSGLIAISGRAEGSKRDGLFTLSSSGKIRSSLSHLPGDSNDPAWNSNGSKIVFVNNQSGEYDLYIMNANGSGVTLIEHTDSSELSPIFLTN